MTHNHIEDQEISRFHQKQKRRAQKTIGRMPKSVRTNLRANLKHQPLSTKISEMTSAFPFSLSSEFGIFQNSDARADTSKKQAENSENISGFDSRQIQKRTLLIEEPVVRDIRPEECFENENKTEEKCDFCVSTWKIYRTIRRSATSRDVYHRAMAPMTTRYHYQ